MALTIVALLIFCVIPLLLTIGNLIYLFVKNPKNKKGPSEFQIEVWTLILGPTFTFLYIYVMGNMTPYGWQKQLAGNQLHSPIAPESFLTITIFLSLAIAGYFILRSKNVTKIPPLLSVLAISAVYIGIGLCGTWIVQVFSRSLGVFLVLFPLNCMILFAKAIKKAVIGFRQTQPMILEEKSTFRLLLSQSTNWPWLAFVFLIPLLGIVVCWLLLFGQKPDAIIKAWIETSDWHLSQRISPENLMIDEHYLCTVAARGHKVVVKPLRIGIRHKHTVIVNRQLCIANAFEQIISEKIPRIHRIIRRIYDTYGYPFAKKISSPFTMDLIYLLMKPLEWLFLLVIYLFDAKPENRIAIQYITKPPVH